MFHREPKLVQHIISRWNVCYHQIHSSSLVRVIFASLTCVGKEAAKSLIWEHVSLEIKSIFFSFQIFPLYPHSSHIREKNAKMLVRVYINHTNHWSSYPVTITHHTSKVFLWEHKINYILLASMLNLMMVIVNYWKHRCIVFVCSSLNMEYEHQRQQLSETALSLPLPSTIGWSSPMHYQVKRNRIRQFEKTLATKDNKSSMS